jgi:hypothetical protein
VRPLRSWHPPELPPSLGIAWLVTSLCFPYWKCSALTSRFAPLVAVGRSLATCRWRSRSPAHTPVLDGSSASVASPASTHQNPTEMGQLFSESSGLTAGGPAKGSQKKKVVESHLVLKPQGKPSVTH